MRQQYMTIINALVVLLLAAGCGMHAEGLPTPAAVLPTSTNTQEKPTPTLSPTETPIPPTSTPIPEPTSVQMELVAELKGSNGPVYSLSWSPDGGYLATTGSDGRVVVWDASTGQQAAEYRQGGRPTWSVDWSADGRKIAVGNGLYNNKSVDGSVVILEAP